ncbi:beta-glucosidase 24-like protein [Tanacetum coccineum]
MERGTFRYVAEDRDRVSLGGKVSMGKSMEGINHYNQLIDELLANQIEPFVTLFHWDLPNALEEEYMGFLSSKIVDDFVDYADICFWEFGDRVKNWVTLNEPQRFSMSGYAQGIWAPGRGGNNVDGDAQTEPYTVACNLLNCHAAAYRKYNEDYKDIQKGRVGITLNCSYLQPYRGSQNQDDVQAVKYGYDFMFGWFMEPLTRGTWPESMQTFAQSATPDYPNGSVLPKFSSDQVTKLIDSHYVESGQDPDGNNIGEQAFDGSWIYLCPEQLGKLLIYIKETYKVTKDIMVTENGSPYQNETGKTYEDVRDDTFRAKYIKEHIKAIKIARDNQVSVTGYFVWSFMDSFEWSSGYSERFGMIYVDFVKDLQRYPKNSTIWYKKFLSENKKILKRSITGSEQPKKPEQASEVSKKLKKART